MTIARVFFIVAAISGGCAVLLGAWFSHSQLFSAEVKSVLQTAVNYQFIHSLALLVVAGLALKINDRWIKISGFFYILGLLGFSGAIYFKNILEWTFIAPVTPWGGMCFVAGWLSLAMVGRKDI